MTLGKGSALDVAALHSLDTKLGLGGFVNAVRLGGPVLRWTGGIQQPTPTSCWLARGVMVQLPGRRVGRWRGSLLDLR